MIMDFITWIAYLPHEIEEWDEKMLYETDINYKISELGKQVEELHAHIMHINSEINYLKGLLDALRYFGNEQEAKHG